MRSVALLLAAVGPALGCRCICGDGSYKLCDECQPALSCCDGCGCTNGCVTPSSAKTCAGGRIDWNSTPAPKLDCDQCCYNSPKPPAADTTPAAAAAVAAAQPASCDTFGKNCTDSSAPQCCSNPIGGPGNGECYDPAKSQCCMAEVRSAVVGKAETCCTGGARASSKAFGCAGSTTCCAGGGRSFDDMGRCCAADDSCCPATQDFMVGTCCAPGTTCCNPASGSFGSTAQTVCCAAGQTCVDNGGPACVPAAAPPAPPAPVRRGRAA